MRKVKRFLSVHEHPESPIRSNFSRQGSDASTTFFPSEATYIGSFHDVPLRRSNIYGSKRRESEDKNSKLGIPRNDLSVIRESSRSNATETQPSSENSITPNSPVPEVLITSCETLVQNNVPLQSNPTSVSNNGENNNYVQKNTKQPSPEIISNQDIQKQDEILQQVAKDQPIASHRLSDTIFPTQSLLTFSQPPRTSLQNIPLSVTLEMGVFAEGKEPALDVHSSTNKDLLDLLSHIDTKETDIVEVHDEKNNKNIKEYTQ